MHLHIHIHFFVLRFASVSLTSHSFGNFKNMVSSLLLRSLVLVSGGVVGGGLAETQQTYQLDVSYSGASFFEGWDFFNGPDPTVGFVT